MRRFTIGRCTALLTLLFVFAAASPQPAESADEVGIYFDGTYAETNGVPAVTPGPLTGYLVLKDPTASGGVAGWECWLQIDGPAILAGADLAGNAINVLSPPHFLVGVGDAPLPGGNEVLLATLEFYVSEELPVSLALAPIFQASIPDEISYLNADGLSQIIPMNTVTGHPEVATIHGETPICTPTLEAMPMGEIYVNGVITRQLGVTNDGLVPLLLDIELAGCGPEFSLPGVSGLVSVDPGDMLTVSVNFVPSDVAYFECALLLGSVCPPIPVSGYGRAPIMAWEGTTSLDFGEVPVGGALAQTFHIENTGELPFEIYWNSGDACPDFSFDPPYVPTFTLDIGESFSAGVWFVPSDLGTSNCSVYLGDVLPTLELTGTGREAVLDWEITPSVLYFPETAIGATYTMSLHVQNLSEIQLDLDISLVDENVGFLLLPATATTLGPGPYTLGLGEERTLLVEFSPTELGPQATQILLGGPLPPVDVTGTGVESAPDCVVLPGELLFDPIPIGVGETKSLRVTNTGNMPLTITPSETSEHFSIVQGTFTLEPGGTTSLSVYFYPQAVGVFECDIDLGSEFCAPVHCLGEGYLAPGTDENLVGFFFDPDFAEFWTLAPAFTPLPVYLALLNCSSELSVGGWECRAGIEGNAIFLNWDLEGQAINLETPPNFLVGTGGPLPYAPGGILLATTQILTLSVEPVILTLEPLLTPSLVGEMAWLTGDNQQIWPMRTLTGVPQCAWINDSVIGVSAPLPAAEASGGQVVLSWPRPTDGQYDGCRVLRRTGNVPAQVISDGLVPLEGETITFVDEPQGLGKGAVLHYSYALIADGREVARSPEVEITLQGVPAFATRLLPNVPNPFNPQTEIRFELDADGPARVTIYDVTGRMVRVLVNESLGAGPQSRMWNGTDDAGRRVSSGAYYVRLETDGRIDHRKVLLLK